MSWSYLDLVLKVFAELIESSDANTKPIEINGSYILKNYFVNLLGYYAMDCQTGMGAGHCLGGI